MKVTSSENFPEDFEFRYNNIFIQGYIMRETQTFWLFRVNRDLWYKKFSTLEEAQAFSFHIQKDIESFLKEIDLDAILFEDIL